MCTMRAVGVRYKLLLLMRFSGFHLGKLQCCFNGWFWRNKQKEAMINIEGHCYEIKSILVLHK